MAAPKSPVNGVFRLSDQFVGDSGCTSLLKGLINDDTLQEIDLSGTNLCHVGNVTEVLGSAVPRLRKLILEWNSLGLDESNMGQLGTAISNCPSLTWVDLRNNRIGPVGAAALARMVKVHPCLKHLDLRWNCVGKTGGEALASALVSNHVLTELQLSGNGVPEFVLRQIDALLQRNRAGAGLPPISVHDMGCQPLTPPATTPKVARFEEPPVDLYGGGSTSVLLTSLQERVGELEKLRAQGREEKVRLEEELQHVTAARAILDRTVEDMRASLQGVRAELRAAAAQNGDLERQLAEREREVEKLQSEAERAAGLQGAAAQAWRDKEGELVEQLHRRQLETDAEKRDARAVREQMEAERVQHEAAWRQCTAKASLEAEEHAAEVARLRKALRDREHELTDELAELRSSNTRELRRAEEAAHDAERKATHLQQSLSRLEQERAAALAAERDRLAALEARFRSEKEVLVADLESKVACERAARAQEQEELIASRAEVARLKQVVASLEMESKEAVREKEQANRKAEKAKEAADSIVEATQNDLAMARARLREALDEVEALRVKLASQERDAELAARSHKDEVALLTRECDDKVAAWRRKCDTLEKQMQEFREEISRRGQEADRHISAAENALSTASHDHFARLRAAVVPTVSTLTAAMLV
eukprot:jgi/Mesvir1/23725/Mv18669-RA.1